MANDLEDWEAWEPADSAEVYRWFSIEIGPAGEEGADIFQVAIATPKGLKTKRIRRRGRFRGIVVKEWSGAAVKQAIHDYVSAIRGSSWEEVVGQLEKDCHWEYSRRHADEYG